MVFLDSKFIDFINKYFSGWNWKDTLGTLAGVIILLSFLLKEVKWIRIVNIFGALGMVIYGFAIYSMPTIILNFGLIIVHLIYLVKLKRDNKKDVKEGESNA